MKSSWSTLLNWAVLFTCFILICESNETGFNLESDSVNGTTFSSIIATTTSPENENVTEFSNVSPVVTLTILFAANSEFKFAATDLTEITTSSGAASASNEQTTVEREHKSTIALKGKLQHKEFAFDAGSNNSIECNMSHSSTAMRWDLTLPSIEGASSKIVPIYNGRRKAKTDFTDLFDIRSVEKNGQWASVVTLLNTRSLQVGLYTCSDAEDDLARIDQRISVVVSKPHCLANFSDGQSTVHELDSLHITCNVRYVGNLLPVFRCQPSAAQQSNQFSKISYEDHEFVTTRVVNFAYVHVINVSRELEGKQLKCSMEFVHDNKSNEEPPTYNFTWDTKPLVVILSDVTAHYDVPPETNRSNAVLVASLVGVLVICGVVITILVLLMFRIRRRRTTVRQKADLPEKKKSIRASIFRERSSGIYDDIVDNETMPNESDLTQHYDEIPDYAVSQPLPYQNLDPATREEPAVTQYTTTITAAAATDIGFSDKKEDDPSYTIALVNVYSEDTSLSSSQKNGNVPKHDYLTMQPDDEDDVEDSDQEKRGESGASTSISDLYAKVHKTGYRRLSLDSPPVKAYTGLKGCESVNEEEQPSNEQTTLLEVSTERNKGDRTHEDDEELRYNKLNMQTKESIANNYTPITREKSGNESDGQMNYHVLNPDTHEPNPNKSAAASAYTKLQQQGTSLSSDANDYHGLDSTTRETTPSLPHEYATLKGK